MWCAHTPQPTKPMAVPGEDHERDSRSMRLAGRRPAGPPTRCRTTGQDRGCTPRDGRRSRTGAAQSSGSAPSGTDEERAPRTRRTNCSMHQRHRDHRAWRTAAGTAPPATIHVKTGIRIRATCPWRPHVQRGDDQVHGAETGEAIPAICQADGPEVHAVASARTATLGVGGVREPAAVGRPTEEAARRVDEQPAEHPRSTGSKRVHVAGRPRPGPRAAAAAGSCRTPPAIGMATRNTIDAACVVNSWL